nr:putative uncharacterized protein DDB_G0294196 [Aegilops tauschii subsp. strangulata]
MVAKHFTDLKEITRELNQAVDDKKLLEKMRREAKSESERKDVNKGILDITKALTVMRNNKIDWHSKMKIDVSQLCDHIIEEIKRQEDLARCREKEEKCQRAQDITNKPKEVKDHHVQSTSADAPIDTSAPLQQIPPSPRPEEAAEQQVEPMVVVPTSIEQEADVVDIYLVNPNEVGVMPEKNAHEEKVDEEIEMERQVPSPMKDIQGEPSGSTKEGEKVEGEQVAAQGTTAMVSSSGAATPMEVDPAPCSLAS